MVTVTDVAAARIRDLLTKEGTIDSGLRMAVMGGGCSGFQYKLEFSEAPDEMDAVIESNGVKVFIDPKSSLYLNGVILNYDTELDYDDGLMGAGFQVENPNARTTCGCGESFSA